MRVDANRSLLRPLGLTPLIDVVFILLLFFMIATHFGRERSIAFNLAGSGGPATNKVETVLLAVAADGAVAVNGTAVDLATLPAALKAAAPSRAAVVVVRAAGRASAEDVLRAVDRARRAGLAAVAVAH